MNISQFKLNETKKLCAIICIKPQKLEEILNNIDSYYSEWIEEKKDKLGNNKTYSDGTKKTRTIRPPKDELKIIQSRIKNNILSKIELPAYVHGGVKGKSNISNAKFHQGNKYIFTTDLQEFYPSISSKRVYITLIDNGFSTHISRLLTKLITWKYEVPQGTPTSSHIANIVFLKTDKLLKELCDKHEIKYTRYVDDLTFSSQKDFKHLHQEILDIVTKNDFKISYRKTKYQSKQLVTGILVLNNKIDAPQNIIDKANKELDDKSQKKPYQNYLTQIRKTNKKKIMELEKDSITNWLLVIFNFVAGVFALYLFKKSNNEKKKKYIFDILGILYNDHEIRSIIYSVDSGINTNEIRFQGALEKEADKTLQYFNHIGYLISLKDLNKSDLKPFKYEIQRVLNNNIVRDYIIWLENHDKKLEFINQLQNI